MISKNGIVGSTFSFGLGVGGIAEGHGRIGYTGIKSFRGEMWMNKISEFRKILTAFFSMIILLIGGIIFEIVTGTATIFFVCFIYAIALFFYIFLLLPINDLLINSKTLQCISTYKIKEFELDNLHIVSIEVTRKGPFFYIRTKHEVFSCFYTEDNYEILKKLIQMGKVDTTIEELDRMVKYSVLPIKRRKNK